MQLTAIALPVSCRKETIRKLLRVMKLVTFIMLVFALAASADVHSQRVTLSLKNAPLEKVFREIQKQTGYDFLFTRNMLKDAHPVDVEVRDAPVQEVLAQCLKGQPLDFTLDNNAIVIREKPREDLSNKNVETVRIVPPIDITGRITNEQGQPLSGASVIIKRTGHGDISNANGNFTLKNVNSDDILIISYIGYKQQKIKVGAISSFTIVMEVETNSLDVVRIQAYGTTTDRTRTGNIATVTSAEIERQPTMNALTALQGKVPGLVITQTSGYASAPFKVELRGRSVIDPRRPSEPLYIVDGVPLTILETGQGGGYASGSVGITQNGLQGPAGGQSPVFSINPEDIESITVLKDADATAIYGSRGANGVIIITTKSGKPGKTKLDVNIYKGASMVTQHYDMMNAAEYVQMRREAFKNDNIAMNISNAYDLLGWDTTRNIDWQKELWGHVAQTTDAQVGVSGGDKQTTFRLGVAYHRQTNIMTVSGSDQRASLQFNLTHKSLNQRLTLSFTSIYSFAQSNLLYLPGSAAFAPNAPSFFMAPGQLDWEAWKLQPNILEGYGGALFQRYISKTGFLNNEIRLQYNLLRGLNFITQMGYSTSHNSQTQIQPIAGKNPAYSPTGSSWFGNNNNSNLIIEPQLEYNRTVNQGKLGVLLGGSLQAASQDGNVLNGGGYTNDNLLYSIANAPTKSASDVFARYKYAAGFARINYDWKDKYIVNLSARRDGSSKFGPGKQYGNFGALGVAWIFTEENWLKKNLPFLSFGKLRGSYGITGSDNIGLYQGVFLHPWYLQIVLMPLRLLQEFTII